MAERIMDTVDTLRMKPLDLERFLLPARHPYLLQELGQLTMGKSSPNSGWPKIHKQRFTNEGLTSKDLAPPEELQPNLWYVSLSPSRQRS